MNKVDKYITRSLWDQQINKSVNESAPFKISIEYAYLLLLKQDKKCAVSRQILSKENMVLDRIDKSKGYEIGNIRWLSSTEFSYNNNHKCTFPNKIIAVSGGLDPAHRAHFAMIESAHAYGHVVVILNSDEWLVRKKGYRLIPYEDRKSIVEANRYVDLVVHGKDSDDTVCETLKELVPDYFGNGGDRKEHTTPEGSLCQELGIETVWGLGGTEKVQSSSDLFKNAVKQYLVSELDLN